MIETLDQTLTIFEQFVIAFAVIGVVFTIIALLIAFDLISKARRRKPHLVDLIDYEDSLIEQSREGQELIPPPPIPSGEWSDTDLAEMRENRRKANIIYNDYRRAGR